MRILKSISIPYLQSGKVGENTIWLGLLKPQASIFFDSKGKRFNMPARFGTQKQTETGFQKENMLGFVE